MAPSTPVLITCIERHAQEPEFFSNECGYDPAACPPAKTEEYIWKVGGGDLACPSLFASAAVAGSAACNGLEPRFSASALRLAYCAHVPLPPVTSAHLPLLLQTMRLGEALAKGLRKGAVEASTHYGRNGHILASKLRQVRRPSCPALPWLRRLGWRCNWL